MRRHISRDKQIPISEKVKKMFRYSPSYEAQKCYSKLPLRYSYASNTTKINSLRQDEIHCEYSSVKEKNLETNECNDTSSWIAKLVSGIQDEDDENRNLHKLSEIENQSLNDLPQDSRDYGDNQFLTHKTYLLFNNKSDQNTPKQPKSQHQVPITNPVKKSIKQALIEIELNEIKQGLKVPPVTRVNSSKKDKENPKVSKMNSKYNSNDKQAKQKSLHNEERIKSPLKQKISNQKYSAKSIRNSLMNHKPKSQAKRKMKTLQKFVEKSIQVQDLNATFTEDCQKVKGKTFESQNPSDQSLYVQTCKNSVINSGTKKQCISKIKNEAQQFKTRKNSLINKEELSECKEQLNMVQQYSRHINIKNLFSEENQTLSKPLNEGQTVTKPSETNKRVGGIKKNIFSIKNNGSENKNIENKDTGIKNIQSEGNMQILKETQMQLKYSYLSTKRQSKDITLNYRNSDPRILIQLDQNPFPSSRRYPSNLPSKRNKSQKPVQIQKPYHQLTKTQFVEKRKPLIENRSLETQNTQKISFLFNKLKLDPTKDFLDKNNLKIRGLNQEQRTQLGSIIAKIHYQNAYFDIDSFEKQFRKMNIECTRSGCLSQEKLHKTKTKSPIKQILPLNSIPKPKEDLQNPYVNENMSFQKQDECEILQVSGLGHRRRNSKIIKKKLFEEIKRISYLQEVATNQLEKNSRITEKDDHKENTSINNPIPKTELQGKINNQQEQYISKDPYIEAPSMYEIETSRRDPISQRNYPNDRLIQENTFKQNDLNLKGFSQLVSGNDTCLIERLNKKLSSYIDKNQIENTFRQFNLNFSELKKHIR